MAKFVIRTLLALVVLAGWPSNLPAQAQNQTPESLATAAVNELAARQFSKVVARFDDRMQSAMPQEKLSAVWDTVLDNAGSFQRITGTRVVEQQGYQVVFVACQFKYAALDVKMAFDSRNRIAGLFFVPHTDAPEPAHSWSAPDYADVKAFHETELTVANGSWKLPATLTLPNAKGPFPAVVLVHGSGPEDQDESIGPNKPFRDLAWGLAGQGVAVLRYVKRTRQYGPQSVQPGAAFTTKDETTDDAQAAVALLGTRPDIDHSHIFLLGHSEGGTLAPRIAAADSHVAGIIIAAGAVRPLEDLVIAQLKYIAGLPGASREELKKQIAQAEAAKAQIESPSLKSDATVNLLGSSIPGSYFLDLRNYRPAEAAAQLHIPILVLQGGRDYQVTREDYDLWKAALVQDPRASFRFYPDLTHLFMKVQGSGPPSPADYSVAGHVSRTVIDDIAQWVKSNSAGR
ncbi:MAG TPA: alpha/beta fold hydrolase [Candidatus Binatia bacterium]|nr:alpha/beta fold hydrolase [Candidatus Binatia bacterium]